MDGWNSEVWKFANSRKIRRTTLFINYYKKSGFLTESKKSTIVAIQLRASSEANVESPIECEKLSEKRDFVERKLFRRRMFTCELGKYGLL